MDPGRPSRQRAPDCIRRQKRRELDARRSKCRIRIGGHLERWCRLKEQLGFALHSQLAQFLLDRYSSHGCVWSPVEPGPGPGPVPAAALQRLVVLSHGHGQECGFVPDVKAPAPGSAAPLVWECVAGHRFSWGGPGSEEPGGAPRGSGRRRSLRRAGRSREPGAEPGAPEPAPEQGEEPGAGAGAGAAEPQVPAETGTTGQDGGSALIPEEKVEPGPEPREEEEEEEEEEDEDLAADNDLTYTDDLRDESYHPARDSESEPQRRPSQSRAPRNPIKEEQPPEELSLSSSSPSEGKSGRARTQKNGARAPCPEPLAGSSQSCRRRARASAEDAAQIGLKRIRKAAKREILLCDFEGCGKIFSNRQYLNHHRKYQHVHQKTFTCSEPTCGKSFNFKKHLKEHEKLHSDKRDYICEFCARSFRTSSNLIIHRRIHTGEKPLQCEVCGFTCRQKASLNWHMRKHGAAAGYQFSCELCGKRFEKRDNVAAHKSKSHPPGERPAPPAPAPMEGSGGDPEESPLPIAEYGEGIGMQEAGASQGQGMEAAGSQDSSCLG